MRGALSPSSEGTVSGVGPAEPRVLTSPQPLAGTEFSHLPHQINTSKAAVSKSLTSDSATHSDP